MEYTLTAHLLPPCPGCIFPFWSSRVFLIYYLKFDFWKLLLSKSIDDFFVSIFLVGIIDRH